MSNVFNAQAICNSIQITTNYNKKHIVTMVFSIVHLYDQTQFLIDTDLMYVYGGWRWRADHFSASWKQQSYHPDSDNTMDFPVPFPSFLTASWIMKQLPRSKLKIELANIPTIHSCGFKFSINKRSMLAVVSLRESERRELDRGRDVCVSLRKKTVGGDMPYQMIRANHNILWIAIWWFLFHILQLLIYSLKGYCSNKLF